MARAAVELHEHDAGRGLPTSIDQLAEIGVLGDQYASLVERSLYHPLVRYAFGDFRDSDYVVARCPQCTDYGCRATLVRHELHVLWLVRVGRLGEQYHFFVRHARRAVSDRSPNILGREMRIIF